MQTSFIPVLAGTDYESCCAYLDDYTDALQEMAAANPLLPLYRIMLNLADNLLPEGIERELIANMQAARDCGDTDAATVYRDVLVYHNVKLAHERALDYVRKHNQNIPIADAFAIAVTALSLAIEKHNGTTRLSTYARVAIIRGLQRQGRFYNDGAVPPCDVARRLPLLHVHRRQMTSEEMAAIADDDVHYDRTRRFLEVFRHKISLDAPVTDEPDSDEMMDFAEFALTDDVGAVDDRLTLWSLIDAAGLTETELLRLQMSLDGHSANDIARAEAAAGERVTRQAISCSLANIRRKIRDAAEQMGIVSELQMMYS